MSRERRRAYRLGHLAEAAAASLLVLKGYRIVARRYRSHLGEIDLIARRGRLLAFVEVKARASEAEAFDALGPAGERRILAAADLWIARHPQAAALDQRFDMILVLPWRLPRHVPDAFRPGR